MDFNDIEARAFLQDMDGYPEGTGDLYLYVICETMLRQGLLELVGAFHRTGEPVSLLYVNPGTGAVVEIEKPEITLDEEQAIGLHIENLLAESAQAA